MVTVATNTDLQGYVHTHVPIWSQRHPMIPKRYVMPWKQDMENRKLLFKIADHTQLHKGPEEESLYLENKERLCHVEDRESVMKKRSKHHISVMDIPFHSHFSRHRSSLVSWKCRLERPTSQLP
ncbi:sperm-associated microtubule inner protein 10 [Microcaecilia unicolor]|uniref:Testis-expressed protein 43 n=1 Tax=Microcaecilia unicolor TaxID=1415580 RepID=A0A6P7XGN6_9AMPH|nr:testis-expressed protein 43 [Microcaecilia unicolor]XP_030049429.1 testis-expressed protein 43 [Microcaecilia unicolor]